MIGKTIDQIEVGDAAQFSKTVSESDIYTFAGVSGDLNPAHINEAYAKNTFFKSRIAHGFLVGSFISTVVGTLLPGPGTIYRDQTLSFLAPVRINDTVTAQAEVTELIPEKNKIVLKTTVVNQDGKVVIEGQAVVHPPLARNK